MRRVPTILYVILLVSGGLIIGSFLNVCIYRLPRRQSLITPQSHCTACGHHLKWFENVPVIGYTLLGGRCRMCGESISAIYPLVEVITSALFFIILLADRLATTTVVTINFHGGNGCFVCDRFAA